jgi:hypothetical protein
MMQAREEKEFGPGFRIQAMRYEEMARQKWSQSVTWKEDIGFQSTNNKKKK